MSEIDPGLLSNCIIRVDVGSRGFGLNTPTSDHDHKGVCIEPFSAHVSQKGFEQIGPLQFKPGELDAYPEGLDLEIYSLKKFLKLAMVGNPNILCILFHPNPIDITPAGKALQTLAPQILSKKAAVAFLGYMTAQRLRAEERGRPKYVEKYGYDTKMIMHLLRLGMQGCELFQYGKIILPMANVKRELLMEVREGKIKLENALQLSEDLEADLKRLRDQSKLPDQPDAKFIDLWMQNQYWNRWIHGPTPSKLA